jgi:hypothetical protein
MCLMPALAVMLGMFGPTPIPGLGPTLPTPPTPPTPAAAGGSRPPPVPAVGHWMPRASYALRMSEGDGFAWFSVPGLGTAVKQREFRLHTTRNHRKPFGFSVVANMQRKPFGFFLSRKHALLYIYYYKYY